MTEEPPGARNADPETSRNAARSRRARVNQRTKILMTHGDALASDSLYLMRGLTDEEAAQAAGIDIAGPSCWWKRASELRENRRKFLEPLVINNLVVTRPGRAGVHRQACIITAAGIDFLEEVTSDQSA
jgi:hypothetical protein